MATAEQISQYKEDGYLVIPDFLSKEEVDLLKSECSDIVNNANLDEHRVIFRTGLSQKGDDYFLNSGDKIRYFFEEDALNEEGDLIVDKEKSLNKIGHALHWWNPVFKQITFSEKIKDLVKSLDFVDPVVVQSMYIFKNTEIGGKVVCHQDATYLYTEPVNLLGIWIPLDDVTLQNGCLWFVPGSHKKIVYQRYIRNPENGASLVTVEPMPQHEEHEFTPATMKKGSCVLIHGKVLHKSEKNTSNKPRPVYTFHIVENHDTVYNDKNWLQPTSTLPFPSLYKV